MLNQGNSIDGYTVLKQIGSGGFGVVWMCEVAATGELRALKWIPASTPSALEKELEAVKSFRARSMRLNCASLLPIEHVGIREDGFFYVLPLADGLEGSNPRDPAWVPCTLEKLIEQRRSAPNWFTTDEIAALFLPLAAAAHALSEAGLVHRDIKPANAIFRDGVPCLADIGLLGDDNASLSHRGTPGFAAPSWYIESGGNADLWGLACTLYTLLTGYHPDKLGRTNFRWPPKGEMSLSSAERKRWLEWHKVIYRATSERPGERFVHIKDFGSALNDPSLVRAQPNKWVWMASIVGLVCVAVAVGLVVRNNHQPPVSAQPMFQNSNSKTAPSSEFFTRSTALQKTLSSYLEQLPPNNLHPEDHWPEIRDKALAIKPLSDSEQARVMKAFVEEKMLPIEQELNEIKPLAVGDTETMKLELLIRDTRDVREKMSYAAVRVRTLLHINGGLLH